MHAQDGQAPLLARQPHAHVAVEATWAKERGVQHVGPVGRRDDHHRAAGCTLGGGPWLPRALPRGAVEAVHLRQELVQGLLPLVVAKAPARARLRERVQLVEEEDARRAALRALEEVPHARRPTAHEDLHEVGRRADDEADAGLVGGSPCQQGLAAAGRAIEQDAARAPGAEAAVALRPPQEVHDLRELVALGVHAGDAGPGRARGGALRPAAPPLLHEALGGVLRELAEHAVGQEEVHERHHQHQRPPGAARQGAGLPPALGEGRLRLHQPLDQPLRAEAADHPRGHVLRSRGHHLQHVVGLEDHR
mmetsp:Transcript_71022/g.214938  ORF Transcript_71022/g.214938 Transcript_71022/m.214938 type:complete len:307 (+) Transcript_71022:377-1297(+)